ncbi:MAG: extracellular solute-binding protein [Mycoplasmatales bacterium]
MKKLLGIIVMLVLVLSGCSSQSSGEVTQESSEELTIWTGWSDKSTYNDNAWKKHAEEITGEKLNFVMAPLDNPSSKLMLDLGSKSPYNVVKADSTTFSTLVDKGIALDLKPYLEEYGQNILAGMTEQSWSSVTDPDTGAIYGIPVSGGSPIPVGATTYRKDILQKEGLVEPTNPEELKNSVCKLAELGYKTPYAINWETSYWEYNIKAAFGAGWNWNVDDAGSLVHVGLDPNFVEYLNWAKSIYDCGGFGSDYETITQEQKTERFINGESVFMEDVWWNQTSMESAMKTNNVNYYDAVGILPPLVGKDGKQIIKADGADYFEVSVIPTYMEKNAVQTIKYINKVLERNVWEDLAFGGPEQQDIMWSYCPDGTTKYPLAGIVEEEKTYYGSGVENIGTLEELSFASQKCQVANLVEKVNSGVPGVDYFANDWYQAELSKYYEFGSINPTGAALNIPSFNKQSKAIGQKITDFTDLYVTGKNTKTIEEFQQELESKNNLKQITEDMNAWFK